MLTVELTALDDEKPETETITEPEIVVAQGEGDLGEPIQSDNGQCSDEVMNGDETDIDCGFSCIDQGLTGLCEANEKCKNNLKVRY